MRSDALSAPGLLPVSQDTGRAAAGRGAEPPQGAAHGRPAEPGVDNLERLAADLLRQLGAARALLLASLIDEVVEDVEGGG